jgi:hypothetical protein
LISGKTCVFELACLFFVLCFGWHNATSSVVSVCQQVASEPRFTFKGTMSAGSHQGHQAGGDATPPPQHHRQSPSPAHRHPRHLSSGHNVIIERVVEKSSAAIVYPTLTHTNYSKWALVMRVNL